MSTREARPLVSVIVPTRNRSARLREALASIAGQEGVKGEFDLETIVVDDASTDATPAVVRGYPFVRYLRLDVNRGPAVARNVGLEASGGRYISFLDDDDLYLSQRLRRQVAFLESHRHFGAVYGQAIFDDGHLWPDAAEAPSGDVFAELLMAEFIYTGLIMIRREALVPIGAFDETLPTMEHHDLFLRLAFHSRVKFLPGAVILTRFSHDGLWFGSFVRGEFERVLPAIVDRALALGPRGAETERLRLRSRLAWFPRIAYWIWQTKNVAQLRAYVVGTLRDCPAVATTADANFPLHAGRVAAGLAESSEAPLHAVESYASEVRCAAATVPALARRRLLSGIWVHAARIFGARHADHAAARRAALKAVLLYPPVARQPAILRALGRRARASPPDDIADPSGV